MSKKIKVALLFGGRSAEHEVSLQSAKNIYEALDKNKYEVVLLGIDKSGKWHLNDASGYLLNSDDPEQIELKKSEAPVALVPASQGELSSLAGGGLDKNIDVVFPILHGTYGEDGTVQGLLELADVAYVGAGVLGSAVGMDKDVMKRLLRDAGIPIGKFLSFKDIQDIRFSQVKSELGLPVFIKPANMGSSVGISKAKDEKEFSEAVKLAFKFDRKIIIEQSIEGREIEVAVLGNDVPVASVPGEVISGHEFYSYEAKYIDKEGAKTVVPAAVTAAEQKSLQDAAIKTFQALECSGLARVDFFLTGSGEAIVNEINTIPGFTSISMYPMLMKAGGIGYSELIDRLIGLALERFEHKKAIQTDYQIDN